jgi:hypothetical protein
MERFIGKIYRNKLSIENILPRDAETTLKSVQGSMTTKAVMILNEGTYRTTDKHQTINNKRY